MLPARDVTVARRIVDLPLGLRPGAASLRVAVYRERQAEGGAWVPAEVSAETAVKLEDAILTRARQIRIAELGDGTSG